MGLSPHVFWSLTFAELYLLLEHKQKEHKEAWERQAYLAAVMINIHRNPKKEAIGVEELMKNPDKEGQGEVEIPDKAFMERIKRKYGAK